LHLIEWFGFWLIDNEIFRICDYSFDIKAMYLVNLSILINRTSCGGCCVTLCFYNRFNELIFLYHKYSSFKTKPKWMDGSNSLNLEPALIYYFGGSIEILSRLKWFKTIEPWLKNLAYSTCGFIFNTQM
jgi:hypothetical protein